MAKHRRVPSKPVIVDDAEDLELGIELDQNLTSKQRENLGKSIRMISSSDAKVDTIKEEDLREKTVYTARREENEVYRPLTSPLSAYFPLVNADHWK